jgi:hypothetical protein
MIVAMRQHQANSFHLLHPHALALTQRVIALSDKNTFARPSSGYDLSVIVATSQTGALAARTLPSHPVKLQAPAVIVLQQKG